MTELKKLRDGDCLAEPGTELSNDAIIESDFCDAYAEATLHVQQQHAGEERFAGWPVPCPAEDDPWVFPAPDGELLFRILRI